MTTVDGMPISTELAAFLKNYCPTEKEGSTFLTGAISCIQDVQDFMSVNLGDMDESEKCEVANYLNDIVLLKKDLIKLAKLLPIVKLEL
jgi:hypothetical protein